MSKQEKETLFTTDTQQIVLQLTTDVEDNRPIYVAGNFNNWKAADELFRLTKIAAGKYQFVFPKDFHPSDAIEYKYTKGDWKNVELCKFGITPDNRILKPNEKRIDRVPRWMNNGKAYQDKFLPKIKVISKDFEIPQLVKTRRIAALLPHDYDNSNKTYPVLYLQDGQNLFDDYAPFGNWGVDKKLAVLAELGLGDIIVIAIDHAEHERIEEFTPTQKTKLGTGDGKKYVRFLADTLKPYVDKHFRTKRDQANTGIGGSSMGALISIYAGFMYPEVYSKLMIFSPALWVAPNIRFGSINYDADINMQIYLYAGGHESENMIPNVQRFKETVLQKGTEDSKIDFELVIDPKGQHNEDRWGKEFPRAIEWLFGDV
ncbi:MAG TPA: alpha/beta hydrolase [Phaeodactylibacter sp.]|nr:alpha/beta hydrolase [Phaeodactylibacter sp.]